MNHYPELEDFKRADAAAKSYFQRGQFFEADEAEAFWFIHWAHHNGEFDRLGHELCQRECFETLALYIRPPKELDVPKREPGVIARLLEDGNGGGFWEAIIRRGMTYLSEECHVDAVQVAVEEAMHSARGVDFSQFPLLRGLPKTFGRLLMYVYPDDNFHKVFAQSVMLKAFAEVCKSSPGWANEAGKSAAQYAADRILQPWENGLLETKLLRLSDSLGAEFIQGFEQGVYGLSTSYEHAPDDSVAQFVISVLLHPPASCPVMRKAVLKKVLGDEVGGVITALGEVIDKRPELEGERHKAWLLEQLNSCTPAEVTSWLTKPRDFEILRTIGYPRKQLLIKELAPSLKVHLAGQELSL